MDFNPLWFAPLGVALLMLGIFLGTTLLLMRHPSQEHFSIAQFIADVDMGLAISSFFLAAVSMEMWLNPQFVDQLHPSLPFLYWMAGGTGGAAFVVKRLSRIYCLRHPTRKAHG